MSEREQQDSESERWYIFVLWHQWKHIPGYTLLLIYPVVLFSPSMPYMGNWPPSIQHPTIDAAPLWLQISRQPKIGVTP
jgi:hypothetical protein